MSLGHSFIPHHHHEKDVDHHHHHEGHSDDVNHHHVKHGDHFDEGLIDYLACIFGEHQHSETPCDFSENYTSQKQTNSQNILVIFVLEKELSSAINSISKSSVSLRFIEDSRQNLFINKSGKRGPPTV